MWYEQRRLPYYAFISRILHTPHIKARGGLLFWLRRTLQFCLVRNAKGVFVLPSFIVCNMRSLISLLSDLRLDLCRNFWPRAWSWTCYDFGLIHLQLSRRSSADDIIVPTSSPSSSLSFSSSSYVFPLTFQRGGI